METKTNFFEKFWYIFVIIALILVAVVSTLWFNNQKSLKNQVIQPPVETMIQPTPTLVPGDTGTVNLETQSDSDEVAAIENDIKATDLSNVDKELADIEGEISTP